MRKKQAFTLIELLVVISIIAVLVGLAMVSFGGAQKQSRDTQRKSDLSQYRNGLQSFAASNSNKFPSYLDLKTNLAETVCPTLGDHLSDCPADPTGDSYTYYYGSDGSGGGVADADNYLLYAKLETGGWWLVCSDGRSFNFSAELAPVAADCDF